jgi:peroxiredoxin
VNYGFKNNLHGSPFRRTNMTRELGSPAPDFSLKSHDDRIIHLIDFRGKKNVVLAFFPLAWTPI